MPHPQPDKLLWKKADILEAFGITESLYKKLIDCGQLKPEPIASRHYIFHQRNIAKIFKPENQQ